MRQIIYSLALILLFCTVAFSQEKNRFAAASLDNEKEVEAFFSEFQKAVANDDRKTVAVMVNFPLNASFAADANNGRAKVRKIATKTTFLASYDKIFDSDYKKAIAKAKFEDLWARDQGVTTPTGNFWMSSICLDKECRKHSLKIITLNSNSSEKKIQK